VHRRSIDADPILLSGVAGEAHIDDGDLYTRTRHAAALPDICVRRRDALVGAHANIGAGTITCNYDGVEKHSTVIESGAFIGSDSTLVAPVRIGSGAYVGAASCVTENVPADALVIARSRQINKPGWARKRRESRTAAQKAK